MKGPIREFSKEYIGIKIEQYQRSIHVPMKGIVLQMRKCLAKVLASYLLDNTARVGIQHKCTAD